MGYSEWREVKLGDLGEIIGGGTPSTKNESYYGGDISWITPKDLSNHTERYISKGERMITTAGLAGSSAKLMPKDTVLFSSRAPIGYVAIAGKELCTNQGFKSIIPKDSVSDSMFLYYLLKHRKQDIESVASGTTFMEVSGSTLKNFNVTIPPLQEQKAIAATLSCLDDKIELNIRINKNLEKMAQAIFKSWFVDFEPFQDGEFEDSELGRIPKGWRVGEISEYVRIRSGYAFKSSWWESEGVPVIKIKEIDNETINFSNISYVSIEKAKLAEDFKVKGGDLLIAMTGATIGKFAIVPKMKSFALVNQRVGKFFLGNDPVKKLGFLYCNLKQDHIFKEIVSRGDGSAQSNISPRGIETIKIIIPPTDIVNKFNQLVEKNFELLIQNIYQNVKLSNLRDTLLPKLMSGEIRVPIKEVQ